MQFSLPKVEDNFLEPPKSFSAVEQISFRKKSATLKGRQLPLDLQAVLPLDLCALEKQHDSIVFYCPVFYSVLHKILETAAQDSAWAGPHARFEWARALSQTPPRIKVMRLMSDLMPCD